MFDTGLPSLISVLANLLRLPVNPQLKQYYVSIVAHVNGYHMWIARIGHLTYSQKSVPFFSTLSIDLLAPMNDQQRIHHVMHGREKQDFDKACLGLYCQFRSLAFSVPCTAPHSAQLHGTMHGSLLPRAGGWGEPYLVFAIVSIYLRDTMLVNRLTETILSFHSLSEPYPESGGVGFRVTGCPAWPLTGRWHPLVDRNPGSGSRNTSPHSDTHPSSSPWNLTVWDRSPSGGTSPHMRFCTLMARLRRVLNHPWFRFTVLGMSGARPTWFLACSTAIVPAAESRRFSRFHAVTGKGEEEFRCLACPSPPADSVGSEAQTRYLFE